MVSVCLYFKVHQPYRLKKYEAKDIDACHCYEDAAADEENINRLANECWLPANEIIYQQIRQQKGKFRCSFSLSGTVLELIQQYRPDVIQSFRELAATGCVEFTAETYYHSLSSLYSIAEFQRQVHKHCELINTLFDSDPVIFRNTELIHNNRIAKLAAGMGFKAVLCEGAERILQGRDCNLVYAAPGNEDLYVLLRNVTLSDDIAFRFGDANWTEHPLTADKFAEWLHHHPADPDVINLFMDYETFGVHKKSETGIFDFLASLPAAVLANNNFSFSTPVNILEEKYPKGLYDVPQTISWEDRSSSSCVWCENVMQNNTLKKIYSIENLVLQSTDKRAADIWGRLQSADYFYYMAEDSRKDGAGKYVTDSSAKEVFQHYTNLVADFEISLIKKVIEGKKSSSRHIPFNILSN
ncbi:glycoside hydrolase family 57 protein [Terrimonas pollutisoli]|uniref:glycoside hydrolase family 57 protein n=1 Tax=Terrimonas pollutisoli TaxID=3034147 RepID=UPI0023EA989C|nr:glycoside hydrolase family 57 protein [Terrimonas sp. H1YJ31]